LLFSAVISEQFSKKPRDYICSGYKNLVSQKCAVFIGPPCIYAIICERHIVIRYSLRLSVCLSARNVLWLNGASKSKIYY